MKKFFIAAIVMASCCLAANAQQVFTPSGATVVDTNGSHTFFASFDVPPIEVTDLGNSVNVLMGGDVVELRREADNPFEYRNVVKAKNKKSVITKAYRNRETGKISEVTVTTSDDRSELKAIVLTFKPTQAAD